MNFQTRCFDFGRTKTSYVGGCGWVKVLFIYECTQGLVWLDSGVLLHGRDGFLELAISAAASQGGVLSDKTSGDLLRWTHPSTFEFFDSRFGFKKYGNFSLSMNLSLPQSEDANLILLVLPWEPQGFLSTARGRSVQLQRCL